MTDGEHAVRIEASGHEHVTATHESTLELTSDDWLTPAGDCILAVEADVVPADVGSTFLERAREPDATITLTLSAAGHEVDVIGSGHPDLTYDDDRSMVCRTSSYVDDRTVMVDADAAAADVDRGLVAALSDGAELQAELRVEASE